MVAQLFGFTFAQPAAWLLWPLPLLLAFALQRWQQNRNVNTFADTRLLPLLRTGGKRPWGSYGLLLLAWTACIWLLAAPQEQADSATAPAASSDVVLLVDISPSMNATDESPTRLERIKTKLAALVAQRPNDRFGIVAFSANAYPVLPLTRDHDLVRHFLNALDSSLTDKPGSNLSRGLELAMQALQQSGESNGIILLASDGEPHSSQLDVILRDLQQRAIPVAVLGAGSTEGAPARTSNGAFVYDSAGQVVISRQQPKLLQEIAGETHGIYQNLTDTESDLAALQSVIARRQVITDTPINAAAIAPWLSVLLVPALGIFLWFGLQRRPALLSAVLLLGIQSPHPAEAAPWQDQAAYEALSAGDYATAAQRYAAIHTYDGYLGLGVANYRQGDFAAAAAAFAQAVEKATTAEQKATALFNRGNALANSRQLALARDSYRAALALRKSFPRAQRNLNLVTGLLEQQSFGANKLPNNRGQTPGSQIDLDNFDVQGVSPTPTRQPTTAMSLNAAPPLQQSLQEDTRSLLGKRFAIRDRQDQVARTVDQPW